MNPSATSQCQYKYKELEALAHEENVPPVKFIAVTETWLQSHITDAQINIENFNVARADRLDRTGGGAALYLHKSIPILTSAAYSDGMCECIFVKPAITNLRIFVIYRPPNSNHNSFQKLAEFIKNCIDEHSNDSSQIIITGDLNFPFIDWETEEIYSGASIEHKQSALCFIKLLKSSLLTQCVLEPTRGNNILDLFCVRDDHMVKSVKVEESTISDHNLVQVCLHLDVDPPEVEEESDETESFDSLNFHKADFKEIERAVFEIDWKSLHEDSSIETFPILFTNVLLQICLKHAPKRHETRKRGKPNNLKALQRKKKRLTSRMNKAKNRYDLNEMNSIQSKINEVHSQIKDTHISSRVQDEKNAIDKIKKDPKFFYAYAKSHKKERSNISMMSSSSGELVAEPTSIANILQDQFCKVYSDPNSPLIQDPSFGSPTVTFELTDDMLHISTADIVSAIKEIKPGSSAGPDGIPAILLKNISSAIAEPLALIWNSSLSQGIVPTFYKESCVCPVHKKGDKIAPENYRPISLTSHIVKIIERILRNKIVEYLEINKIFSPHQHGFRSGRSTLTQLIAHMNDIFTGLCMNEDTDSIYLDYAKAFDKVDHNLLIAKLKLYKFNNKIVAWITSFLRNRRQVVVVEGVKSRMSTVISGVPQGTVLGPVLFLVYMNDLENVIHSSTVRFFADDTRISRSIGNSEHHDELQDDLSRIMVWSTSNNMMLHEQKFELLVHEAHPPANDWIPPFPETYLSYKVSNEHHLYRSHCLRDLGVQVCSDLSWSNHIHAMIKKTRTVAAWVLSVFSTRDAETMLTLYKSLVRSNMEYCCPLWHPIKIGLIEDLESIQREFTYRIEGCQALSYWDRLKKLKLMSLQRRRERYILLMMWKILHEKVPNDTHITFRPISRLGVQAIVPNLPRNCSARNRALYDSSFAVVGPSLWNHLPSRLNSITSEDSFKNKLTEYLLQLDDEPPVQGYTRAHNNTLGDVTRRLVLR